MAGRPGPSAWAGFTVDVARGLVFVPTGQASGGGTPESRTGINLYSNCLLALDANTGKLKWYFQAVHHDHWDYDVPAPPALIDVKQGGRTIPAVAQLTKQGMLFILDRTTGQADLRRGRARGADGESGRVANAAIPDQAGAARAQQP